MSKKKKVILLSGVAIVCACVLCFTALFVAAMGSLDRDSVYDGVYFKNIHLGGMSQEQVKQLIAEYADSTSGREVTANFQGTSIVFSPSAVGFNYDTEKMAQAAYDTYRTGSKPKRAWQVLKGKFSKTEIASDYLYDEELFKQTVKTLLAEQGLTDAPYRLTYSDTAVMVDISESGLYADLDDFYEQMKQRMVTEDYAPLELHGVPLGAPSADDIYNAIYVKAENARAQTVNGKTNILPHVVGISVDKQTLENQLQEGKKSFQLRLIKSYPAVRTENIEGEFFHDVLATYRTYYNAGLVGRTQNVSLAARKINGTVLNNGDIFSFNKVVGKRTSAAGFSTATVYTNGQLAEELGGGICQVSSTLYNAALMADLKIVERRNHMFTVAYAKNGLDATVAYGSIDFRFQNNYSEPIKILTSTGGGVLTVTILGTKERNIKVELTTNTLSTTPFETEYVEVDDLQAGQQRVKQNGQNGYKVTATKTVKDANGAVLRTESLGTSVYQPLKKIIEVSKGTDVPTATKPTAEPTPDVTVSAEPSAVPTESMKPTETPITTETQKPTEEPVPTETSAQEPTEQPTSTPESAEETEKIPQQTTDTENTTQSAQQSTAVQNNE